MLLRGRLPDTLLSPTPRHFNTVSAHGSLASRTGALHLDHATSSASWSAASQTRSKDGRASTTALRAAATPLRICLVFFGMFVNSGLHIHSLTSQKTTNSNEALPATAVKCAISPLAASKSLNQFGLGSPRPITNGKTRFSTGLSFRSFRQHN